MKTLQRFWVAFAFTALALPIKSVWSLGNGTNPTQRLPIQRPAETISTDSLPLSIYFFESGEPTLSAEARNLITNFIRSGSGPEQQAALLSELTPLLQSVMSQLEGLRADGANLQQLGVRLKAVASNWAQMIRSRYAQEIARSGQKRFLILILPSSENPGIWGSSAAVSLPNGMSLVQMPRLDLRVQNLLLASLREELRRQNIRYREQISDPNDGEAPTPSGAFIGQQLEFSVDAVGHELKLATLARLKPGQFPVSVANPDVDIQALIVPDAPVVADTQIALIELAAKANENVPQGKISFARLRDFSIAESGAFRLRAVDSHYVSCPNLMHLSGRLKDSAVSYDFNFISGNRVRFAFRSAALDFSTGRISALDLRTDVHLAAWFCGHPGFVTAQFEQELNALLSSTINSNRLGSGPAHDLIEAMEAWEREIKVELLAPTMMP